LSAAIRSIGENNGLSTVVLSGGVFQNQLLLEDLKPLLDAGGLTTWVNHAVPPNDGGISLGQAALAAFAPNSRGGAPYA
jgi:hydrogenase maturation protein HypF